MNATTCFDILHLSRNASLGDAKKAYKRLVKLWHPDQYANDPEKQAIAEEKLKELNIAYRNIVAFLKSGPFTAESSMDIKGSNLQPEENRPDPRKRGEAFWDQIAMFISKKIFKSHRPIDPEAYDSHLFDGFQRESPAFTGEKNRPTHDFEQVLKKAIHERRSDRKSPKRPVKLKKFHGPFKGAHSYRVENSTRRSPGDRVEKITPVNRVNRIGGD